ncbi:hypothetical protein N7532_003871 [Penicillium argentinense]|uniref:F-box domain-containing protein n=1 Tax=Penicillium argentinense TaxID=1131581 RepID=A0A9W9FNT1_9EURO|nr:uncharacterized protein N7532_003871 [Penicillium argentinense]KAJ5103342.1 hypothetical protein N7532_003871 [Penicillium argentinense]
MGPRKLRLRKTLEVPESSDSEPESETQVRQPFPFLRLPSEIRLRIYHFVLFTPTRKNRALQNAGTVGSSAKKSKAIAPTSHRIALFLVSRSFYDEASHMFYSSQIFRLFPVQDFSRRPTVRAIPRHHRPSITTIELILGNSWTAPPRSWTVNQGLGLHEMTLTRTLKVFIECDPSQPVFEGFRISKEYYTEFAGKLMQQILKQLPGLVQVEFDGYPSVRKGGDLMVRLLHETEMAGKKVLWGPQRGWTDYEDDYVPEEEDPADAAIDGLCANNADSVDALTNTLQAIRLET